MNTKVDRNKRYESFILFFELDGNSIMKLSSLAAIDVCKECTRREMYVWRIEGGIWHSPGFEARIDCIWDSCFDPKSNSNSSIKDNNRLAEEFVKEEMNSCDVFIATIYKENK
ncbi:colicin transporter [Capnocytophaga sp. oral taxon 338]|uniref:colicin transporter n=1 Tax=Capnocytophaga sp. oral taxon 338 TaxID=710239 RepID=UPI000202D153|nr:colicin transporter [Capnocytophaga sp. oral taxon 338]EGD34501.1 colicin-E5 immunity protein in ColE9 [Capnocytophaga sp. oral taxon 338 str. F0234]